MQLKKLLNLLHGIACIAASLTCVPASAAIPASERAVLDAIYAQAGGPNWGNKTGWGGTAGSECSWFGVTCASSGNNVTEVRLVSNNLVGTLPSISALTQLQVLAVKDNKLSGNLPSLTGLTQFTSLFAGINQFSGSIPSLAGLTNLRDFYVFQNQLSGSIPALTGLVNLQYFHVEQNQLTGNVPSLAGLSSLIEFQTYSNQLSGSIPSLTGLTNLRLAGFGLNKLSGTLPSLAGLVSLQVFNGYNNNLTGTIPSLSGLTNLKQVNLSVNQLSGSIPSLSGLTNLVFFEVPNNQLTGSIPNLSGLVNLDTFYAFNNQLTGGIPALTGLNNLVDFEVDGNHLTGSFPALTGLTKLTVVLAGFNQLTGSLPSLTGLTSLQTFVIRDTQLTGSIPSLAGLTNLQTFAVFNSQLTGSIPPLTGLTNLQLFAVHNNQLTGPIPPLDGLSKLQVFAVSNNRLSGTIPSLANLPLQYFFVGGNGLSGAVPTAPGTLLATPSPYSSAGLVQSTLCNNALTPTASAAWDAVTGASPWYTGCTSTPSTLKLATADTGVATGTQTTITATVTASALGASLTAASDPPTGDVTITDDNGKVICYIKIANGTGSCNVVLPGGSNINLNGGYSGNTNIAPSAATIPKTTPVTVSGNLDQHGWTGTWYNPATSGQGFVIEIYPDLISVGNGLFGGSWFTFDSTAGGEDKKRWYTLVGPVSSTSATTTLDIISPTGGNFNAAPIINSGNGQTWVGHATLNFSDCATGSLSYSFTDGSNRVGNIPLKRLDSNVTCDPTNGAGNGTNPGKFLLSGAWYTPSTSGQGLLFDINPLQNIAVAAWYTYAPNGQSVGGGASQRWYTLQIASANVGNAPLNNIGIFSAQGGTFDAPGGVSPPQVGTAIIGFNH